MLTNPPAYSMRVFWSENDHAFIAVCPELNDISAFGPTYEDAVRELQVAVGLAVEVLREENDPIPAAAAVVEFSGQLRVRLPKTLHRRLSQMAEDDGVSLNTLIVSCLSSHIGQRQLSQVAVSDIRSVVRELRAAAVFARVRSSPINTPTAAGTSPGKQKLIGVSVANDYISSM